MMKKRITGLVLILAVALVFSSLAFANPADSALSYLKLTVEISPANVYPPIVIYTAQLGNIPPITSTKLIADFYNINTNTDPVNGNLDYLGSAPFDNTGKAVLYKQMKPGYFVGIAKTEINGKLIWSNRVEYKVY